MFVLERNSQRSDQYDHKFFRQILKSPIIVTYAGTILQAVVSSFLSWTAADYYVK